MNDTTRRFLSAIVERVPSGGEIAELRLFPAMRQGGIESGVAVVAVQLPQPHAALAADGDVFGTTESLPTDVLTGASSDASGEESADAPAELSGEGPGDSSSEEGDSAVAVESDTAGQSPEPSAPAAASDPRGIPAIPPGVHALVDTDVVAEEEEGSDGDATPTPATYVPMADTTGDDEVADALDAELTEIVVAVEREVIAAEGRRLTSGEYAAPRGLDEPEGERSADVSLSVEPYADDESPYADAPAPAAQAARPILADAPAPAFDERAEYESAATATSSVPADSAVPNGEESIELGDILALPSPESAGAVDDLAAPPGGGTAAEVAVIRRYAILSASYRLTIKGPDRGKWEVEVTHEADAPLDTVERVARGVAKRAGEAFEPEHFSGESLRAVLAAPAWATTP